MRVERKQLMIDEDEQNTLIRILSDMRNIYKEEGITTDAVDDLIIKINDASSRRVKAIEVEAYERG